MRYPTAILLMPLAAGALASALTAGALASAPEAHAKDHFTQAETVFVNHVKAKNMSDPGGDRGFVGEGWNIVYEMEQTGRNVAQEANQYYLDDHWSVGSKGVTHEEAFDLVTYSYSDLFLSSTCPSSGEAYTCGPGGLVPTNTGNTA